MEFEEKTISRREIYKGPIFQLVQDQLNFLMEKGQLNVIWFSIMVQYVFLQLLQKIRLF